MIFHSYTRKGKDTWFTTLTCGFSILAFLGYGTLLIAIPSTNMVDCHNDPYYALCGFYVTGIIFLYLFWRLVWIQLMKDGMSGNFWAGLVFVLTVGAFGANLTVASFNLLPHLEDTWEWARISAGAFLATLLFLVYCKCISSDKDPY